jgi:ribosomal protein L11 methyltransferase
VPDGVEELDVGKTVEFAVYGAPGELPALPALRAAAGSALVEVSTSEVPDDWSERWRRFHRPVLIDAPAAAAWDAKPVPGLYVRPPWEAQVAPRDGLLRDIVIDPGQAFGTGSHATTRMCLELLLALAGREGAGGPLLDVGTGSGVLAIAAASLGFDPVLGLDHEQESVQAARENAAVNGVQVDVRLLDLRSQALPWPGTGNEADGSIVVVANLLRPLLLQLARALPAAPAHLLAGGLLSAEVDEVTGVFAATLNLRERERRHSGDWAAVWLASADQAPSGSSVAARTIER